MKEKQILAVIDTNVIVSALLNHDGESIPSIVLTNVISGNITPLYNEDIISEYKDVLSRDNFPFRQEDIESTIDLFVKKGILIDSTVPIKENYPDLDDVVFYEVAMSMDGTYLVTGNIKHFPINSMVVTPAEMVEILKD
ncbi:MAG: putative toxin-antitoxin system toxin component, PIN family [Bacteroidaceae bacterium]|nr:putative toxin-antitoxin system toxin component, PIN family [Bacteroidaceae bacterium]